MKTSEKMAGLVRMAGAERQRLAQRFFNRGFTLIEMVIVIALIGVVSSMVALFIRFPVVSYLDSAARADVTDTGDAALRRMARDVRLALPNSLRVATDTSNNLYLEMILTRTGGRYLSTDDNPTVTGNPLNFAVSAQTTFDIVGPAHTAVGDPQQMQAGSDSVVVYNLGPGIAPADAYNGTNSALITAVSTVNNVTTITMQSNPFAIENPNMPSPYHRFQVISGPVTYAWNITAKTLTRYWGYAAAETQPNSTATGTLTTARNALMATGVSQCSFLYSQTNSLSNALLEIDLVLQAPSTDVGDAGSVSLFQQIHVDNTP